MLYFDNAYRTLGLYDNATRSEARGVFHQLKIRSRIGTGAGPADPLAILAPAVRTEETLRDAYNALGNVNERLRQRLFWFSKATSRDSYALDCIASGDFKGAAEAWAGTNEPGARANLARLYHALVIARDILPAEGEPEGDRSMAIPKALTWIDAIRSWRMVAANDKFWEEFEATERASGFEPPAVGGDVASLRGRIWESLLQPSLELLASLIERKEYGLARDHLEDLRDAEAPAPRITELEKESFVPVTSALDAVIDEITVELDERGSIGTSGIHEAYERYRREALPFIRDMLRLAGYNFEPSRQLCDACADFLRLLAQRASATGATQYAQALYGEGNAIAKGEIEAEKRVIGNSRPLSGTTSGASSRSKGSNVPWWVVAKLILLLIGGVARLSSCGDSSSPSYSSLNRWNTYSDYPNYKPSVDLDSFDIADIDTASLDGLDVDNGMKVFSLRERRRALADTSDVLLSLLHSIDKSYGTVYQLDSEAIATRQSDSVTSGVAKRAMKVWLDIYLEKWESFDDRYTAYRKAVDELNRDIRKLPRSVPADRRPEKLTPEMELQTGYAKHGKAARKWGGIKGEG